MVLNRQAQKLINFLDASDFRPQFTKLSKKSGIPISTLHDAWKQIEKEGIIRVRLEVLVPRNEYVSLEHQKKYGPFSKETWEFKQALYNDLEKSREEKKEEEKDP